MPARPVSIPLFSPQANRYAELDKDSRLVNGFAEKGQGEQKDEIWIYRRPGFTTHSTVSSAATGRGVFNWQGDVYSVFGTSFYKNTTLIGAVDGTDKYTFTSCLGATPTLLFHNSVEGYTYNDTDGLDVIADPQFPSPSVPGSVYIDGTTYVMDEESNIQGSDFNDQQNWQTVNVIVVQIEPDRSVALAKQLVYAVAMKEISTEVFYDAGNAVGSPLGPVQGSKMNFGCRAAGSVRDVGDALCWATTDKIGEVRICKMEAVKGDIISTQPIEKVLSNGLDWSETHSWAMNCGSHRYYGLTIVEENLTLVFDLSTGLWYQWTDSAENYLPYVDSTYDANNRPVLQHRSNGKLYTPSFTTTEDDGANIPWKLYTPNFEGGQRTSKSNSITELVADQVDADVDVSWSDDDFVTYTTPQTINLNQERPMLQDGSSFRRRTYLLESTDATRFRIKAIQLMVDGGTA
jgi:hypothetical protein